MGEEICFQTHEESFLILFLLLTTKVLPFFFFGNLNCSCLVCCFVILFVEEEHIQYLHVIRNSDFHICE